MRDRMRELNDATHKLNIDGLTDRKIDFILGMQFAMHYILDSPFKFEASDMIGIVTKIKNKL